MTSPKSAAPASATGAAGLPEEPPPVPARPSGEGGAGRGAWLRELAVRLLSAAVLVALAGGLLFVGGIPLDVLVGAVAVLCAWELTGLLRAIPAQAPVWLVGAVALWVAEAPVLPGSFGSFGVILPVALLGGMVAAVALRVPWSGWAAGLGGGLYLGVGLGSLLGLDHWPHLPGDGGMHLLAMVVGAVIATDTLAYFGGRLAGAHRHRFFPSISPHKSVEGAVAGAAGAVLVVGIAGPLALGVNAGLAVGLGVLIAVAGVGGDLAESALKRQARVKDSGRLIPGHGGLLDRVDGLLLAGAAAYALLTLIGFRQ